MKLSRAFLFAGCCLISACTSQMKGVAPQQLVSTLPDYPYYALANHLDGEVTIRFDVGANGKVEKMWILTSEHSIYSMMPSFPPRQSGALRAISPIRE